MRGPPCGKPSEESYWDTRNILSACVGGVKRVVGFIRHALCKVGRCTTTVRNYYHRSNHPFIMNAENNIAVATPSVVAPTTNVAVPPVTSAVSPVAQPKPRFQRSGKKSVNPAATVTPQIKR